MRRASIIPKAAAAAVCLIIALVLSLPVLPVMSNRMFAGGTLDFNEEAYSAYRVNRPVGGEVFKVLGSMAQEDEGGNLTKNSYYYLVPVGGRTIDNKNKADTLVLIKVPNGSAAYNELNDVLRASADGDAASGYELSGVLQKITDKEIDIAEELQASTAFKDLEISDFVIDLSVSVSFMTIRFVISLVFLAAAVLSVFLMIQAINKNAEIDGIEESRIAFKLEQDKKSGNTNDDGSDKMFGDSDASYGVTPRRDDNDMLGESGGSTGGYNPAFQSQGGGAPGFMSDDDAFGDSMLGRNAGGFLDDDIPESRPSYMDDPADQGGYGGGQNYDDDGFFGGGGSNGGFFGGR